MHDKLMYASIVALALGYLVGRIILRFWGSSLWLSRSVGFSGGVIFFVGLVAAYGDRPFFMLAAGGLGLQLAWTVRLFTAKVPVGNRLPR
jgi:hypothetical protein